MQIFDLILIIILFAFVFYDFFVGFIIALGSVIGVVIGSWVAGRYYLLVYNYLQPYVGKFEISTIVKAISFILIFILVNRLCGLLFYLLDKIFNFIAIIPFLKTFNRLFGAILGFIEGSLIIGLSLYVVSRYSLGFWFDKLLSQSEYAPSFIRMIDVLKPFLPEVLKQAHSIIQ